MSFSSYKVLLSYFWEVLRDFSDELRSYLSISFTFTAVALTVVSTLRPPCLWMCFAFVAWPTMKTFSTGYCHILQLPGTLASPSYLEPSSRYRNMIVLFGSCRAPKPGWDPCRGGSLSLRWLVIWGTGLLFVLCSNVFRALYRKQLWWIGLREGCPLYLPSMPWPAAPHIRRWNIIPYPLTLGWS